MRMQNQIRGSGSQSAAADRIQNENKLNVSQLFYFASDIILTADYCLLTSFGLRA
jgi:hypothetical protein